MIEARGLSCGYPGRMVLSGVSLTVSAGEFVAVLGPNGAGKTTLLLALTGLLPSAAGEVRIMGEPLSRLTVRERALRLAVVSQDGAVRLPFPCREVVRMGRFPHEARFRMETEADREAVERAMVLTDVASLADRLVTNVSGGERQRVMLARALAQETPVLLLDEAVSAMDVHRKMEAFQVLCRMNREEGTTVLAVLHDVNLAALFCRRIVMLREGRVVADGATEEVLTPEVLSEVYRARALVHRVVEAGGRPQVVFLPKETVA